MGLPTTRDVAWFMRLVTNHTPISEFCQRFFPPDALLVASRHATTSCLGALNIYAPARSFPRTRPFHLTPLTSLLQWLHLNPLAFTFDDVSPLLPSILTHSPHPGASIFTYTYYKNYYKKKREKKSCAVESLCENIRSRGLPIFMFST